MLLLLLLLSFDGSSSLFLPLHLQQTATTAATTGTHPPLQWVADFSKTSNASPVLNKESPNKHIHLLIFTRLVCFPSVLHVPQWRPYPGTNTLVGLFRRSTSSKKVACFVGKRNLPTTSQHHLLTVFDAGPIFTGTNTSSLLQAGSVWSDIESLWVKAQQKSFQHDPGIFSPFSPKATEVVF